MTLRDVEGAVRFLSTGNLKFNRETRELHQDKVTERRKAEGYARLPRIPSWSSATSCKWLAAGMSAGHWASKAKEVSQKWRKLLLDSVSTTCDSG